jgi:hypothetical protein
MSREPQAQILMVGTWEGRFVTETRFAWFTNIINRLNLITSIKRCELISYLGTDQLF